MLSERKKFTTDLLLSYLPKVLVPIVQTYEGTAWDQIKQFRREIYYCTYGPFYTYDLELTNTLLVTGENYICNFKNSAEVFQFLLAIDLIKAQEESPDNLDYLKDLIYQAYLINKYLFDDKYNQKKIPANINDRLIEPGSHLREIEFTSIKNYVKSIQRNAPNQKFNNETNTLTAMPICKVLTSTKKKYLLFGDKTPVKDKFHELLVDLYLENGGEIEAKESAKSKKNKK